MPTILIAEYYDGDVVQIVSHATGTAATSGDNELIAAPGAGTRLVIKSIVVQNESTSSTTTILKDGSTAAKRLLLASQGDAVSWHFDANFEWRLADNSALNLNLSGANSHGYTIEYWEEATS